MSHYFSYLRLFLAFMLACAMSFFEVLSAWSELEFVYEQRLCCEPGLSLVLEHNAVGQAVARQATTGQVVEAAEQQLNAEVRFSPEFSQEPSVQSSAEPKLIQFSGILIDEKDLSPLSFASVVVENSSRGTITNINGFFTFAASVGDRICFSHMGYKTVTIELSDTLSQDFYSIVQSMVVDTIALAETVIYPWPSREKFKEAFINLVLPQTEADYLRKNFELAEMRSRASGRKMDAGMNYRSLVQERADRLYHQGQIAPISVLNPFAWISFVKKLKAKDKQDAIERALMEYDDYGVYSNESEE